MRGQKRMIDNECDDCQYQKDGKCHYLESEAGKDYQKMISNLYHKIEKSNILDAKELDILDNIINDSEASFKCG